MTRYIFHIINTQTGAQQPSPMLYGSYKQALSAAKKWDGKLWVWNKSKPEKLEIGPSQGGYTL